ncbi:hypothetical protein [Nocardia brasiliensis]|uniref:hypothetical protein n=1 Tax=Nocardia brasiliensis TaxID=37326 RepID=UPI002454976B|nr:hypothetical protein [Nocardia brasiliensis]
MSWLENPTGLNDPAYYVDAPDHTERRLRADAARHFYLLTVAPFGETTAQTQQFKAQAAQLATTWGRHESIALRTIWQNLQNAITHFGVAPEQARQQFAQLQRGIEHGETNTVLWRNWRQAAELTGHYEPGITGSDQDSARWQRVDRSAAAATDLRRPATPTVLDRALGATSAPVSNQELPAIINGTATPLVDPIPTQRQALEALQNLYAEHTRTVESHSEYTEYGLAKIDQLEAILATARQARVAAAQAGAPAEVITAVQRAGVQGTYWHERPGDPRRHPGPEQTPASPRENAHEWPIAPGPGPDSPDPPATTLASGGAEIGEAVQAAVAEHEHADWHDSERRDIDALSPIAETARDIGI